MEAFVDEKAIRVENIFLDFLKNFKLDHNSGEPFYELEIEAMKSKESTETNLLVLSGCSIVDVSAKDEESASYVQDSSLVNKIFGGRVQSKDTREPDLQDLFNTFGHVSHVYIAYDQKTGISRGFGFVNFVHKDDAKNAIAKLNGYGYDNLILRVEWVAPRTNWIVSCSFFELV
ncbi:hypothetical protein IFM89_038027 [Coptis chinensis]|uniref:RRM domain-containing protein n=1 Tax=Coptis chinensis TaxID=261450 RepID=A0A835HSI3_9MAGN|nr:hypothetical protein IFM89_038027 [Coptis chinensis]